MSYQLIMLLKELYADEGSVTLPAKLYDWLFDQVPENVRTISPPYGEYSHLTFGNVKIMRGES